MSSGNVCEKNVYERLFRQWASVCKLVIEGKRDPEAVSQVLQTIIAERNTLILKADWGLFYRDVFGLGLSLSGLVIPAHQPGFDRLLVIAQGMTPQRLFNKCTELFNGKTRKYTDRNLDEIITSDRTAINGHYAVWVRDRQEADEENKNLSADQLKERGTVEITLEERMLYELKFFKETGDHLDKKNLTLCAGSRYPDGRVPSAYWDGGRFGVHWGYPYNHNGNRRSRSAVS